MATLCYHLLARKCGCSSGLSRIIFLLVLSIIAIYLMLSFYNDTEQHRQVMNVQNLFEKSANDGFDKMRGSESKNRQSAFQKSDVVPNCGMKETCSSDTFPIHVYTGKDHNDTPKLCINGRYIFDKSLNNAGRGLNVALVDSVSFQVIRVGRFDTYAADATQLELFLEKYIKYGDIVVMLTFDEASQQLSNLAKQIISDLGSGCIQNLKFRSSWYFVSQKGIEGFTPYEKLSLTSSNKNWGDLHDVKFCVPRHIVGQSIHPDMIARRNKDRQEFCTKNSGYGDFCSGMFANEPLFPAPLVNTSMKNHPIFSVPIIVLAGMSLYSLPMTLETLLKQPGLNAKMVTIYYLPVFTEAAQLAALFNFSCVKMTGVQTYEDQIEFAFNKTMELYPDASHMIFLEEELVLTPDFLYYMAQTMPLLEQDPTLYSISAWNDNGYKGVASNPEAVYRVEGFPGLGFMISKTTYIRQMQRNMKSCCSRRAWDGWALPVSDKVEMVIPDVSRVVHRPYEGLGPKTQMLENLFNRERPFSHKSDQQLEGIQKLLLQNYEAEVAKRIQRSVILEMNAEQLEYCFQQGGEGSKNFFAGLAKDQRQSYVLYFKQVNAADYRVLQKLCRCFGLFHAEHESPRGLHKGMLRFTPEKNEVFFVGSASPYYSRPV